MFSKNHFHWRVSSQSQKSGVYRTGKRNKVHNAVTLSIMILNFKLVEGVCIRGGQKTTLWS